ncbi:tyrosine-type recombinase/integrase [Limimaricola variabilis]|uniref:site-specific integrase n=1 Tax=Limimaricola variabilis TaxID=1492771 RepID=UPI002AC8F75C|nr:tyrosine-type recombinase/integrase [Limimaricola variabilis]WPY96037.1 tyrosine-type recombinase/integrase [Limimaricola variabilis]
MADPRQRASDGRTVNIDCMSLSEAVVTYLRLKGDGKGVTFHRAAERAYGYLIDTCGDKPLTSYTKADANAFRDALIARGMAGSSITRVFGTVRSIINFAANEEGIELTNPFAKVYYDRSAGVSDRQPIPVEAIRAVQAECYRLDDEMRWLVALVADTGMRLAEAAGLLCEDIVQDDEGNYSARITPHPWRRLKTAGSTREVPLVGSAHWAAERLLTAHEGSGLAFPRYNKTDTTNANAASAGLNKWLKIFVPDGSTMHSFRHSMRDRLRAVECPADIVDQIGGWQTEGVGHGYGKGYPLTVVRKWMEKVSCRS